jgi:hypothetical protein
VSTFTQSLQLYSWPRALPMEASSLRINEHANPCMLHTSHDSGESRARPRQSSIHHDSMSHEQHGPGLCSQGFSWRQIYGCDMGFVSLNLGRCLKINQFSRQAVADGCQFRGGRLRVLWILIGKPSKGALVACV